jgi:hypothetical protein
VTSTVLSIRGNSDMVLPWEFRAINLSSRAADDVARKWIVE